MLVNMSFDAVLNEIDGDVDLLLGARNGQKSRLPLNRTVPNPSAGRATNLLQSRASMANNVTEVLGGEHELTIV